MLKIDGLSKSFGNKIAVDELNLSADRGDFLALLGPNGAGKTTTIRMIAGLARPASGNILIDGKDAGRNAVWIKQKIGIVHQYNNLDGDLTVSQNLELHGRLYRMKRSDMKHRTDELLDFTELSERRNDGIQTLSGGMKRRLMIARAMLHCPEMILLDEPTVGLDPESRRKMWDMMKKMNTAGLTILLTTHYMEEAEVLCNKVIMIDNGKKALEGTPDELKKNMGNYVAEYFDGQNTKRFFFENREFAVQYASKIDCNVSIRKSNLEDVYFTIVRKKDTL